MNNKDFTYLLQNPEAVTPAQTEGVKTIINQFPYFQSARAIYLKGLKNQESFQYNQELKTAAAYTTDRSILFDFITSEDFIQNVIKYTLDKCSEDLKFLENRLLEEEKNKVNNTKRFAVDVIDQTTNVLIVSGVLHPDLGMLKKAITTNEQRSVTFIKPQDAAAVLNDYQLVILYQPDSGFAAVYKQLKKLKKNTFVFTGLQTDWSFVNKAQNYYSKEVVNQNERVTASLNSGYGAFGISPIGFADFPPLQTKFGSLYINTPHQTILEQYVDGIASESPMLATIELDGTRHAIWDGEDLWKWRSQSYRETQSFEDFDTFIGKMVQYLGSNKRRSRLEVSSSSFYYNNNPIKISTGIIASQIFNSLLSIIFWFWISIFDIFLSSCIL